MLYQAELHSADRTRAIAKSALQNNIWAPPSVENPPEARSRPHRDGVEARACIRSRFHYVINQLEYRDPADRLLITTAIEFGCPLVTYDERTLRFVADYGRPYGFAARA